MVNETLASKAEEKQELRDMFLSEAMRELQDINWHIEQSNFDFAL